MKQVLSFLVIVVGGGVLRRKFGGGRTLAFSFLLVYVIEYCNNILRFFLVTSIFSFRLTSLIQQIIISRKCSILEIIFETIVGGSLGLRIGGLRRFFLSNYLGISQKQWYSSDSANYIAQMLDIWNNIRKNCTINAGESLGLRIDGLRRFFLFISLCYQIQLFRD